MFYTRPMTNGVTDGRINQPRWKYLGLCAVGRGGNVGTLRAKARGKAAVERKSLNQALIAFRANIASMEYSYSHRSAR